MYLFTSYCFHNWESKKDSWFCSCASDNGSLFLMSQSQTRSELKRECECLVVIESAGLSLGNIWWVKRIWNRFFFWKMSSVTAEKSNCKCSCVCSRKDGSKLKRKVVPAKRFAKCSSYAERSCLWSLKISEESLGRDETPRQTSHEHFTSITQKLQKNITCGQWFLWKQIVYVLREKRLIIVE